MNIKYRRILSLLFILVIFSSCANLKLRTWQRLSENGVNLPENFWFTDLQKKALYKINIEAFHQKQSGTLMVKQDKMASVRLLMVTEFGLKVFDVEYFKGDSVQLHYIMKHLDNPYIVNTLFDNLKVFWPNIATDRISNYFFNEKKNEFLYRIELDDEQWHYLFSKDQQIKEIIRFENGRKRSVSHFDIQTKDILLKTKGPSISIRLKKIDNAEK